MSGEAPGTNRRTNTRTNTRTNRLTNRRSVLAGGVALAALGVVGSACGESGPKPTPVEELLGLLDQAKGDKPAARRHLVQAIQFNDKSPVADEARRAIEVMDVKTTR